MQPISAAARPRRSLLGPWPSATGELAAAAHAAAPERAAAHCHHCSGPHARPGSAACGSALGLPARGAGESRPPRVPPCPIDIGTRPRRRMEPAPADLSKVLCVKQLSASDAANSKQIKLPKSDARKFVGELRHKQSSSVVGAAIWRCARLHHSQRWPLAMHLPGPVATRDARRRRSSTHTTPPGPSCAPATAASMRSPAWVRATRSHSLAQAARAASALRDQAAGAPATGPA